MDNLIIQLLLRKHFNDCIVNIITSLSELTPIIFHIELTHLGSNTSNYVQRFGKCTLKAISNSITIAQRNPIVS